MTHLVCIGFGFSAAALARRLAGSGVAVTGTTRGAARAERIVGQGAKAAVFDGCSRSPALAAALADTTHVVVSVSPDRDGCPALRWHGADLAGAPRLGWIGYLSTVGVYGDRGGAWVDEDTAPAPTSARSIQRLAAEEAWRALGRASGKQVESYRIAGIYGPGRSAVDNLRNGTAHRIVKPGQVFNRIHVDDIALVLATAMAGTGRHDIYNLADDEPAPAQDVVAYAATLLGIPPPPEIPFEAAALSPAAVSFYDECKRVSNARVKADFNLMLHYPTYREGIAAIARAQQ